MKNLTDHVTRDPEHPLREEEGRNRIKNISEKEPESIEYILMPDNQVSEVDLPCDTDRRVLERYHKGIFACPLYAELFEDGDDARIN